MALFRIGDARGEEAGGRMEPPSGSHFVGTTSPAPAAGGGVVTEQADGGGRGLRLRRASAGSLLGVWRVHWCR